MKLSSSSDGVPLADRAPTPKEIERLRLLLSVFQDGSGTLESQSGTPIPDWRNFEDVVDAFFGVTTPVDKDIFDVLVPYPSDSSEQMFGISCKMKKALRMAYKKPKPKSKHGRAYIELSNPAKELKRAFNRAGVSMNNYSEGDNAAIAGKAAVEMIRKWHEEVSVAKGGKVLMDESCYLSLLWDDRDGRCTYRMYGFEHELPDPSSLDWYVPDGTVHIKGCEQNGGIIMEVYPTSGGQIKYYPRVDDALWMSDEFDLASLPGVIETDLAAKAKAYFEDRWDYTFQQ